MTAQQPALAGLVRQIEHPAAQLIRDAGVQFEPFLPKGTDVEAIAAAVYLEALRVPQIMDCDKASIVTSAVRLVKCGFDIGRTGFLVPFKGKCTDVPHYRGYIEVITASGAARDCDAREVRVGDFFEYEHGTAGFLKHVPGALLKKGEKPGAITHAYALWYIGFGRFKFGVMNAEEVGAIHAKSAQWSRTPLQSIPWYWVKSAVRKSAKLFAQNPKLAKFFRTLEEDETTEFGAPIEAPVVDAPLAPVVEGAQEVRTDPTPEMASGAQVDLVDKLSQSHVWSTDEREKFQRLARTKTKRDCIDLIERVQTEMKKRKDIEKAAAAFAEPSPALAGTASDELPF